MPRAAILCLMLVGLLAGCTSDGHFSFLGYTTRPNYDPSIKTVYIPLAQNVTYRRELEFYLTKLVVDAVPTRTTLRVVSDRSQADTELDMKIVNRRKALILPNPLNEIRDQEVSLQIEVVWKDLRPGHVGDVLSNPKRFDPNELPLPGMPPETAPRVIPVMITPVTNYQPELGGSTFSAEYQAMQRAAIQITQMMEKAW